MSGRRFDVCTPRLKRDGGTYWVKIGSAWEGDKGTQVIFDALPIPDADGRCAVNLFEPKPRDGAERDKQHRSRLGSGPHADNLDDNIPF